MKGKTLIKTALYAGVLSCCMMFLAVHAFAEQKRFSIAGAGVGQSAYIQAAAVADYISKNSKTIALTAQTTKGYVHNARLVNNGETDFGLCGTTIIYPGLLGIEKFSDGKLTNIRGVINSGDSLHCFVTLQDRGIKTFKDMVGKRVNLGAPGSNTRYIAELTLKAYGILDKVHASSLDFGGSAAAMMDGKIDVASFASAPPVPAIMELFSAKKAMFVTVDDDMIASMIKEHPAFVKVVIPPNTYVGQTKAANCLGYPAYLLAHKDVPDWAVYDLIKEMITPEAKQRLITVSDKWTTLNDDDVPKLPGMSQIGLMLHPGAEKFWKEKGLEIPANISSMK
jgi:TRAP transporter TAXI family solute receptor